jgi:hypothetical protein
MGGCCHALSGSKWMKPCVTTMSAVIRRSKDTLSRRRALDEVEERKALRKRGRPAKWFITESVESIERRDLGRPRVG